ncbi:hypothetical protein JB92DRAFT_639730 [Gautieria morchelliformis]|nr:hypothetical protein JB92DRAFT_639730 [Gautieria morchelliformis]
MIIRLEVETPSMGYAGCLHHWPTGVVAGLRHLHGVATHAASTRALCVGSDSAVAMVRW